MKYGYEQMPDKTMEGLHKELESGLTIMAIFFFTSYGIPLDIFNSMLEEKTHNMAEQMVMYLNFRNKYPKLYD